MAKKQKASTATVAEVAATHVSDAPAEIQTPATPADNGTKIVLFEDKIQTVAASWSKSETRDAVETVKFAITKMVDSAESKMSVGQKFNDFAKAHGDDKCRILRKETGKLGISGLSESNIELWQKRAVDIVKHFPNPLVRRFVLAMTGGEGVIVRDDQKELKEGETRPYILSPFFQQATEKMGNAPDTKNEDVAEKYVRGLVATATGLRSQARTNPEDVRIREACKKFTKRLTGWIQKDNHKHESLVYKQLDTMLRLVVNVTEDLDLAGNLSGALDQALTGKEQVNGQQEKSKSKAA